MKRLLPKILAVITQHDRTLITHGVDFEWSINSYIHNAFRVYELVFGRRFGIRAEFSSWSYDEGTGYAAHSFEGACALTETYIRNYLASWTFVPFRIYIPTLQTTAGFPVPASPYLFAIAFDAVTQSYGQVSGTTATLSHTATGSNLLAVTSILTGNLVGSGITSVLYNGSAMTGTGDVASDGSANLVTAYLYWKVAPSTGSQTISVTAPVSYDNYSMACTSYSGAAQTGQPDAHSKTQNTSATTSTTLTVTTVADNSWLVGIFRTEVGGATVGAGTTSRYNNGDGALADSGGAKTPAGSYSLIYNFGSSVNCGVIMAFAPAGAATTIVHRLTLLGAG